MVNKSTIKYIQSLQHKKFRDKYGVFMAEGPKVVADLLASEQFVCTYLFALKDWMNENALEADWSATSVQIVEPFELEKIATYASPNKVVACFKQRTDELLPPENKVSIVLDDIRDPGNLGTIIRTADWFGIPQIICSCNTVDKYNPKVVQSTMASLANVNVVYTDVLSILQSVKVKKFVAALEGKNVAEVSGLKEGIIIIGNESHGVSDAVAALADERITIPKFGKAESLNAAIACSIISYVMRS